MRAPFQILVLPYRRRADGEREYCVFKRRDFAFWQFIAGGGEDDETPAEAARRELCEEAGFDNSSELLALDSMTTIPKCWFEEARNWPKSLYVVPERCFAVDFGDKPVLLSEEHTEYAWLDYEQARKRLKWDSNRNALWELRERLNAELREQ
jgi:dATP pyrophosphohydrolase